MRLPTSFNDITISQFQECYFINKSDPELTGWARIISILSGTPIQEIEDLPLPEIKKLKQRLLFILDDKKLNGVFKKHILVNGRWYKAIHEAHKLSTAQGVDIKTFLKPENGMTVNDSVVEKAHKLLASVYLPLTWKGFKYNGANHSKIAEDFRHAKMGDVYGTLFFYLINYQKLIEAMEPYGQEATKILEDHLKEVTLWANTVSTGDGR